MRRRRNRNQIERPRGFAPFDSGKVGTLGDIVPNLIVRVWCTSCRHMAETFAEELVDRHGPELQLEAFRRRSTCSVCGAREANLHVVPDTRDKSGGFPGQHRYCRR